MDSPSREHTMNALTDRLAAQFTRAITDATGHTPTVIVARSAERGGFLLVEGSREECDAARDILGKAGANHTERDDTPEPWEKGPLVVCDWYSL